MDDQDKPPFNPLDNFGDKSAMGKRGRNTFSSENQPAKKGRKKVAEIRKLMRAFGKGLAPKEIREHASIVEFLEVHNMKGTVHECMIARLYSLALYGGDLKAIKMILDTIQNNKYHGTNYGVVIQFVEPPAQESDIHLESDSWTVSSKLPPGEAASD